MRLYRDRPDVLTEGRWQFCPPGAKPVPYFHLFGSSNYDPDGRFDPPVGEVGTGAHPWSNGKRNPRLLGQNTCGTEEQWTTGSLFASQGTPPVDADGVPLCCQALPLIGGGDGDGAECWQNWGYHQEADGGDGEDGQANQFLSDVQVASGGDGDDGIAIQFPAWIQVATGGDGDDGIAIQFPAWIQVATGGDGDDGQANQFLSDVQVANGGDGDDGQANQFLSDVQVAGGGDGDDGQANQVLDFLQAASGGDSDDGQADQVLDFLQVASGGDGEDGEAEQFRENGEVWLKYVLDYTQFQVAGTSKQVTIQTVFPTMFIHEIVVNVATAFTMSAGGPPTGEMKYGSSSFGTGFILNATTSGREYAALSSQNKSAWPVAGALGLASLTGSVSLTFTVSTTVGSLANLTAGSLEVWVNVSVLA